MPEPRLRSRFEAKMALINYIFFCLQTWYGQRVCIPDWRFEPVRQNIRLALVLAAWKGDYEYDSSIKRQKRRHGCLQKDHRRGHGKYGVVPGYRCTPSRGPIRELRELTRRRKQ